MILAKANELGSVGRCSIFMIPYLDERSLKVKPKIPSNKDGFPLHSEIVSILGVDSGFSSLFSMLDGLKL